MADFFYRARNPVILRDTLAQARRQNELAIETLEDQRVALRRQLRGEFAELEKLVTGGKATHPQVSGIREKIDETERSLAEAEQQLVELKSEQIDEREVADALRQFDELWDVLTPAEQYRIVDLMIETVTYDGNNEDLQITYRPSGIRLFRQEDARNGNQQQEPVSC